ncbi:DJ-1/PfpI family protein [Pseudoxanthobacter sp.]|uniref:DJ-1/PfpI family protein n=1 Tax=Pseudoxanthobacter sp. TaxID=1925742 RepID=UPI002FE2AF28
MPHIRDSRILIVATEKSGRWEVSVSREELRRTGARVDVATLDGRGIEDGPDPARRERIGADLKLADARPDDYEALVLSGFHLSPEVASPRWPGRGLVLRFLETGRPVGAMCHGPWLPLTAEIFLKGGPGPAETAMGEIMTSRAPADVDDFIARIVEEVELRDRHHRR